ncbi:MAG: carbohydrate-binding protein [Clostridia bacterium]|nr:carbohydrate-binding protein [Clostridia bacterium]
MYNNYIENGVIITPNVVAKGDKATVIYRGLLHNSGAHSVLMRIGYGDNWNDTHDVRMSKTAEGFEAVLPVNSSNKLNVCFKDCANNWDNNSGNNYSFQVEER